MYLQSIFAILAGLAVFSAPAVSLVLNPIPHVEAFPQAFAAIKRPTITITEPPLKKSSLTTQTIKFFGTAPQGSRIAGYRCSLDSSGYTACSSPLTLTISLGKHIIRVRAIDSESRHSRTVSARFEVTAAPLSAPA